MKHFNAFLESLQGESVKDSKTPKNRLTTVAHEQESEQAPASLQQYSGMELGEDGLWHWRQWIVPTYATMPAYRRHWKCRIAPEFIREETIERRGQPA